MISVARITEIQLLNTRKPLGILKPSSEREIRNT